ncbi:MAG TPA: glycosyl transferase family 2 [Candidatus Pacebacteria bacterium]|nr:glycosyl transferase family 2 [Candidatus Paceibacterota bacterium]
MSPTSQPKFDLSLIILNFNAQFWLKKTLESLEEFYLNQTKLKVEVIVVDNHSLDDSVTLVKKNFKWVRLIESPENNGFAAGNNLALKEVRGRYCMLLNNDLQFTQKSNLDQLVQFLDKNSKVGVVTPKLVLPTGDLDWACHRGEPSPWASLTYFFGLEKLWPANPNFGQYHLTFKNLNEVHLIDACSGAALMLRTSALDRVGLLDEQFFMYAEDLDWCRRFRDAAYQIVFFPTVEIIHHKYKSGIKSNSKATVLKTHQFFYDTMLQYYDKYYRQQYPEIFRELLKLFIFMKKGGV